MKKLEWQFSTGIAGGIVFSLGIPGKNGMVGKYVIYSDTGLNVYIHLTKLMDLTSSYNFIVWHLPGEN